MKLLKAYRNGELLFDEVENANHFFSRFMGLMFRRHIDDRHALLLSPCDEIHTFFMKFDIDAVMLDKNNTVLCIDPALSPGLVRKRVKGCKRILEMNSGMAAKHDIKICDKLIFE